jgi:UDP-N-acetylmuramate dehydrogenase
MRIQEHVLLSQHTTFRIGGPAALFITAESCEEVKEAYELARKRELVPYPLGQGSNVLAGDEPIHKAIITLSAAAISYMSDEVDAQEKSENEVLVYAEGGVSWDALVEDTVQRGLWGLENLAGIPGTVGAAPVQNIGAYGVEVQDAIRTVNAYDSVSGEYKVFTKEECGFAYRDSRFKREPGHFVTGVTFALPKMPSPRLMYKDIQARYEAGAKLDTPADIAREIRAIRAQKFPDLSEFGTAGSFFKNPVISVEHYEQLHTAYPELAGFKTDEGIKIPIAWILDHVLNLNGFIHGRVSLFKRQPLVIVAKQGATERDVDALAALVSEQVKNVSNIFLEREVQSLK